MNFKFNALKYTEELEKAGFSRNEAEASLKVLIEVMNENFATKADLEMGFKEIGNRFLVLNQAVESRFAAVDSKFQELEDKLTIKLGTMMVVAIGFTATFIQLLK